LLPVDYTGQNAKTMKFRTTNFSVMYEINGISRFGTIDMFYKINEKGKKI
jgi:hypothetical protein